MERLLDHDPHTGVKTWFSSSSEDGGTWNLRYEQDTSPILDQNKKAQARGFDKRSEMWHAARIPTVVMLEWKHRHGVEAWNPNHKAGVRRLLDDPEYRYLRVQHFMLGKH
ncbi:MAG: hypothetical protein ACOYBT_09950 [Polynucleobacter sp.]